MEPIFIRSVPKKDHRRLWTLSLTERVKRERAKYRLHVKIYPSRSTFYPSRSTFYPNRSIFFTRVNGPLVQGFSNSVITGIFLCLGHFCAKMC